MLIRTFAKALRNLFLPEIMKLFLICLLAYALGFTALSWLISAFISSFAHLPLGETLLMHMITGIGGMVISWLLFPLLYPILVSFFDDKMAAAIEREDYPQLLPAQPPFWPNIWHDILFVLKAIGLNILCLPLYVVPGVGLITYYGLNGYLLGVQFFRMAAGRRVSMSEARNLQYRARNAILITGVAISLCSTVPILNLAAPLLGVATMLHLFHALKGTDKQEILLPR